MQFAALGHLHGSAELVLHGLGERPAGVAAIDQHACDLLQVVCAAVEGHQRAVAIRHLGRGDGHGMRQALGIDRDVALDAGDLLARVVALPSSGVGVLHALGVYNQEAGRGAAPLSGAGLAN